MFLKDIIRSINASSFPLINKARLVIILNEKYSEIIKHKKVKDEDEEKR